MNKEKIILVTGQSGIKVRECLEKLNGQSENRREIVSIEDKIRELSNMSFHEFIGSPQYLQYEYWMKAFDQIFDQDRNLWEESAKPIFLTFHAVYYHQKKRELFPPVSFEALAKLKNRVKILIVFIDDIFDVYRRLMDDGQMFEDVLDDKKTKPLDAIFSSIFNIISLLNWREMEISLSRAIANILNTKIFIVSTKHPSFMINRLIETPLDNLKIYYLSHPITAIREEANAFLQSFIGKLESLIEKILDCSDTVLFFPTSIDELIIKREKINKDKYYYYPELIPRWSHPYKDQLLSPSLPSKLKNINPLNPLNYNLSIDKKNPVSNAVSHLVSLLWHFIYLKQIISRDYSLVEQSENGIIACRPYFEGLRAGGVIGELSYNFLLMKKQSQRKSFIFSCSEDRNKLAIHRLFTELYNYLAKPPKDLMDKKENWIRENYNIIEKQETEIRKKLENDVLPKDYDFSVTQPQDDWSGDSLEKKAQRKKEVFKKIYKDIRTDEISVLVDNDIKERFVYKIYTEREFWDKTLSFIEKLFGKKGGKQCLGNQDCIATQGKKTET